MRVKSHWFNEGKAKTPAEIGGALAFIIWRVGQNMIGNLRRAEFEVNNDPRYFDLLDELLVFLVLIGDRIAYRQMDADARVEFTSALANRLGETLAENRSRLMGEDEAAAKAGFIERLNGRAGDYAVYEYGESGPEYGFLRQLAHYLHDHVDERDRFWISDQIIGMETPEAVATLEKSMRGLLGLDPKPNRRKGSGGE